MSVARLHQHAAGDLFVLNALRLVTLAQRSQNAQVLFRSQNLQGLHRRSPARSTLQ